MLQNKCSISICNGTAEAFAYACFNAYIMHDCMHLAHYHIFSVKSFIKKND